jgi:drug/metabolite transporter (DMT)-like permease
MTPTAAARPRHRLALTALLGGATAIGFAPIFVRLSEAGPSATAAYRLAFALPLLWAWACLDRRLHPGALRPETAKDFWQLALAGLFFAADMAFWHWSLRFTTVANSTLLTNLAPVLVTIGARVLFGERITGRFLAGLVVALAGAAMLVGVSVRLSARHLWGDALSVFTALFYAGYLLSMSHLRQRFRVATIMAWSGLVSAPTLALAAWLSCETLMPATARGWLVLVGLALVSHVGGQSLIAFAFGHLPASFTAVSLLWQPVVAALVAWIALREPLSLGQIVGGVVVLCGIALAGGLFGPARKAPD